MGATHNENPASAGMWNIKPSRAGARSKANVKQPTQVTHLTRVDGLKPLSKLD
jgi:hypothetical protein